MFSAVRKHLNPTTGLAFVALVFAMTGGAFAASSHGGGSPAGPAHSGTGMTVATVAKSKTKPKAGARGPVGPKGATGAAGPAGPAGAQGPQGAQGPAGTNGTNGTNGEKGEKGAPGAKGEPGTTGFTEFLPSGKTEAGDWSMITTATAAGQRLSSPISFVIPLEGAPTVHFIKANETAPAGCTGSVEEPGAEAGNLCVFFKEEANFEPANGGAWHSVNPEGSGFPSINSVGKAGTVLLGEAPAAGEVSAFGTWAVTASS